jgi:pimeloyl-ACP methyl ester carboxylesterase
MTVSINYHREGEGPPLLLLHGVGHHWQTWVPVIERLADEFDVIACDSPGFGRSAPLGAGIEPTIPAYADAFEWFLVELGLERPHVAGISMGGAIALELGRRRAVRSVTAIAPVGFWTPAERRFCQVSLGALARVPAPARPLVRALVHTRAVRHALYYQLHGYPARLPTDEALSALDDAWSAPAFKDALAAFGQYRFEAPEKLRKVPVTIAWGRHDRLLLYSRQAPRARALLPWATHVTLGAGHLPCHDDPAAVAEVIRGATRGADAIASRGSPTG